MPPRTGFYLLTLALLFAAALLGAYLATANEPPTVAPIDPNFSPWTPPQR